MYQCYNSMLDIKVLHKAIEQLASEKDLPAQLIFEAVEAALASAYKKEYEKKGENIRCVLNDKDGTARFYQVKTVVDETTVRFPEPELEESEVVEKSSPAAVDDSGEPLLPLYNQDRHILLSDALAIKEGAFVGDELLFELDSPSSDFGRIAAQTAKQVVLQKLREIEKDSVRHEFEGRVGNLVTGLVQRIERGTVFVDLGKTAGVMPFSEGIPGEHYRIGERLKFYLLSVQEGGKSSNLILSRSHPQFVAKLFELEVPEINDGVIEVKGIVREAGSRTKIAVGSSAEGVDPVGACVGQRGARVMAVNNELGNERIDIIEWSDDPESFVAAALSPAEVASVELVSQHEALVLVPEDQLSLAIGRGGQNVRLAAKLTGWKIDVRSESNPEKVQDGGIAVDGDSLAVDSSSDSDQE